MQVIATIRAISVWLWREISMTIVAEQHPFVGSELWIPGAILLGRRMVEFLDLTTNFRGEWLEIGWFRLLPGSGPAQDDITVESARDGRRFENFFMIATHWPFSAESQRQEEVAGPDSCEVFTKLSASSVLLRRDLVVMITSFNDSDSLLGAMPTPFAKLLGSHEQVRRPGKRQRVLPASHILKFEGQGLSPMPGAPTHSNHEIHENQGVPKRL